MFLTYFYPTRNTRQLARQSKLKCRRANLCFEQFEARITPAGTETDGVAWVKVLGDDPARLWFNVNTVDDLVQANGMVS